MSQAGMALIFFAILSFVTALVFNVSTDSPIDQSLPPTGGVVGPITVEKDRTVYQIQVGQELPQNGPGNQVTGIVLDKDKNPLFSFGEDFWSESGYDSDGSWSEKKTSYDIKVTLEKGSYFFELESDNSTASLSQIRIIVKKKGGSAVPFFIAGIIALIIGVILNEMSKGTIGKGLKNLDSGASRWG